jgi:hypothetical protein
LSEVVSRSLIGDTVTTSELSQGAMVNAKQSSRLRHCHLCAPHMKENAISPIRDLLFASSPSAVSRRVIAIVIDPVERQSWGRIAHVSVKVFEGQP